MLEEKDWFEQWFDSPYYSNLYDNRDEIEAKKFVDNLIQYLHLPANSRLLDIACGEGRHSLQLSTYGHFVTGIDLAAKRIEVARLKENDRTQFFVHDMRFPLHVNYFDAAFNFFTSFGYFERKRDHHMAARAFSAAIKKGGTLVIDYLNKQYTENRLVAAEDIDKKGVHFAIRRSIENKKFIKNIKVSDPTRQEELYYQERVSAFTLQDFLDLFIPCGLTLRETFGDYNLQGYDPINSPRMIMIFEKL
jgi:SAM-dependent methyltransferase